MGIWAQAFKEFKMTPEQRRKERGQYLFDILCANNRPDVWCVDVHCDDTNWGGYCRLHSRGNTCPDYRLNGGWF